MKKLFTLMMILAVATTGFAQVKHVSKLDGKNGVQKMRMVDRSQGEESLQNVLSQPLMTRGVDFGSGEMDYTTYDWQSNDGARTWTLVWDDGKVNFAHTNAYAESFSDRGTGIGTYDFVNDEWIPLGGRIESEKTGFGSIARYKENGIVVAAHTATECGIYIIEDRDNMVQGSLPVTSRIENSYEPAWPVVMTSGPDRDIIHLVATGNDDKMYYFRTRDGGDTWDKQNVILPYFGEEYGSIWNSNCCYFMETTEDNCLAIVVNNAWSDGMVMYSYDDGETWERKVFYKHPGINASFDSWFMYPRYTSCQWDSRGNLHVVYEFNGSTGEPGSGSYYPGIGGVAYWSENLPYHGDGTSQAFGPDPNNPMPCTPDQPFIMDSAYIYNDVYASLWRWSDATHEMWEEYIGYLPTLTDEGEWEDPYNATEFKIDDTSLHGSYNSGCVSFPVLCMVPGSDDMVAVWSAMDENCTDGQGNFYYHLFAAASADGGYTWTDQVALTSDIVFTYAELVYNQATIIDRTLIVATQADGATGTFVQGDEDDASDCFYQGLTYDIDELFPNIGLNVAESHNTKMVIWPNPAVNTLNISLNHNSEIVVYNIMGQVVANYNGTIGANSIDVSNLSSGVYFISAGSDTQKFVVK